MVTEPQQQLPRAVRKGPLITVDCKCGETRKLKYGQEWTCEKCGRHWNTNKIPVEEYAAVRRTQLKYRRLPLIIAAVSFIAIVLFISFGEVLRGLVIVALIATSWSMFARPMHKRKYRQAIAELPEWEFEPDRPVPNGSPAPE